MPELPEITAYQERLQKIVVGQVLREARLHSHFLLRTVAPELSTLSEREVTGIRRAGKQIVLGFEGEPGREPFAVIHLMITGRLRWKRPRASIGGKSTLLAFDFDAGTLLWTEASSKKRSSLHLVEGEAALAEFDRGGLEVLESTLPEFAAAARRENRTLKRALTDPRLFSGIGNAFSDEILFAARLSPVKLTSRLTDGELARLHDATRQILNHWIVVIRDEIGDGFPDSFASVKKGMAVHGRYREPCVVCERPVQRIRYAENECNYCAECQNAGRLLADRGLSQLMRKDWPKTLDELEDRRRQ
jgi:formamidopyrimidine-DNA glycosylase